MYFDFCVFKVQFPSFYNLCFLTGLETIIFKWRILDLRELRELLRCRAAVEQYIDWLEGIFKTQVMKVILMCFRSDFTRIPRKWLLLNSHLANFHRNHLSGLYINGSLAQKGSRLKLEKKTLDFLTQSSSRLHIVKKSIFFNRTWAELIYRCLKRF